MNSEMYVKQALDNLREVSGVKIYSSIDLHENEKNKKRLLNSAKVIGQGIETSSVIGLIDMSLFGDGKEGAVFTGTDVYIRETFSEIIHVNLKLLSDITYNVETYVNKKGTEKNIYCLSFTENAETKEYKSETELTGSLYKLVAETLQNFTSSVENVGTSEQDVTLDSLGEDAVLSYLKIIFQYLNVDGVIQHQEMLNMASLLGQLEISSDLDDRFRNYRFGEGRIPSEFKGLIKELKTYVPEGSQHTIFQSLINDLVAMKNKEELEHWKDDSTLINLMQLLAVTEEQTSFFVRHQQLNNRQIEERLEDNQVKELTSHLAKIGAGTGASLAALATTGAAVGAFGTYGLGTLAIATMSTGGLALAAAGIGAAGVAGYKGLEHLTSSKGKEKYGIRNELLQKHVIRLTKAQQFLMADINQFAIEMDDLMSSKEVLTEKFDQIKKVISQINETARASAQAKSESGTLTREQLLSELPVEINEDKLNSLLRTRTSGDKIRDYIKRAYPSNKLDETLENRKLEVLQHILNEIDYNKLATTANAKEKFGLLIDKVK